MTQTHDGPARHDVPPGPLGALAGAAWQALLVAGLVSVVLGILVLVWPDASLRVAGVLFGLYLLFSGVMQLVAAFGTHATTALRVMAFISGALSILLGLFCFRGAMQSTLLLALWIGIGWLFRGITQTVAAASDPAMPATRLADLPRRRERGHAAWCSSCRRWSRRGSSPCSPVSG